MNHLVTRVPLQRSLRPRTLASAAALVLLVACGTDTADDSASIEQELFNQASSGLVSIEAEHFTSKQATASSDWALGDLTGASGGNVMQATGKTTTTAGQGGQLAFQVNFAISGRHYLWLRGKATGYGNNSAFGGSTPQSARYFDFGTTGFEWQREDLGDVASGVRTVSVWVREAGFALDKIVITQNAGYTPSGLGPSESNQGGGTGGSGGGGGVREYNAIGTKNWTRTVFNEPPKGWGTTAYNQYMRGAVQSYPAAFTKHYPAIASRVLWNEAYVDPNQKPTAAQARDPKWSNYIWNKPGSPSSTQVWDGITDALNSPEINNGAGVAKLLVSVALSMSANSDSPPMWMRKDSAFTWNEGPDNANKVGQPWHVRFDNPAAVDQAAWFMEALLKKYGNNKGLYAIAIGESYFGNKETWPSGLDRSKYLLGIKDLWNRTSQAAPKDSDGRRVNLLQISPLFDGTVSMNDLKSAGFGMAASDTYIQLPLGTYSKTFADGYKNGMHTSLQGDARYACTGRRQSWDETIANPFGHQKGYSGVATPQELFWYHGAKGPVPMNSIFMTLAPYCTDVQVEANWRDGIKRFGRGGTQATWGPSPVE